MPILEVNLEQHRRLESVFRTLDVKAILLELEAIGRVSPGPETLLRSLGFSMPVGGIE